MFILYSINFQVMGRPNIGLHQFACIFDNLLVDKVVFLLIIVSVIIFFMSWLIHTPLGLGFRAFGENRALLARFGGKVEAYRFVGLAISNGLAALAGSLTAQNYGVADLNMGFGMAITGIGAVVIGHAVIAKFAKKVKFNIIHDLLGCLLGGVIYFFMMNLLLWFGIEPINLRVCLGLVLIAFLRLTKRNDAWRGAVNG